MRHTFVSGWATILTLGTSGAADASRIARHAIAAVCSGRRVMRTRAELIRAIAQHRWIAGSVGPEARRVADRRVCRSLDLAGAVIAPTDLAGRGICPWAIAVDVASAIRSGFTNEAIALLTANLSFAGAFTVVRYANAIPTGGATTAFVTACATIVVVVT